MKVRYTLPAELSDTVLTDMRIVYECGPLKLDGVHFQSCEFEVHGPAADGIAFMKAMFEAGGKLPVMKTFLSDSEYEMVADALGWHGKDGGMPLN